jgi:hypothetical protein
MSEEEETPRLDVCDYSSDAHPHDAVVVYRIDGTKLCWACYMDRYVEHDG